MILVVAEWQGGAPTRATYEVLAAAQACAAGVTPVRIALLGAAAAGPAETLAALGVGDVLLVDDPALDTYTSDGYVTALQVLVTQTAPTLILLPHSYQARDYAPRLVARLAVPVITDAIRVDGPVDSVVVSRPVFQGRLVARVRPTGAGPAVVSVQVGAYRADAVVQGAPGQIARLSSGLEPSSIRQQPEPPFREARQAVDLNQAERIVAVGRGIKAQEHVALAERLAATLHAELGASRPICDNGWLPMERQIGSSGQTVAPRLYVALGISGAIQHLVGMKGAGTIVAINKDPDAPIFEVADYGIVADLFEVVPALITALEQTPTNS